jgi:hypothetical protein
MVGIRNILILLIRWTSLMIQEIAGLNFAWIE